MTLFQKLERKLGRYAIPDLMKYISVVYVVGFLIMTYNPYFYYQWLMLNPEEVLHGQIWRLVTFLFYYPGATSQWDFIIFALIVFVYYSLGTTLERIWGTFKYNFFYVMGVLMLIVASLGIYLVTWLMFGQGYPAIMVPIYMSFSIFLAYALTFPEATFLLYFLIPIKAKYLALAEAAFYVFRIIVVNDPMEKVAIGLSLLNVIIFFFMTTRRPNRSNIFNIRDYR